MWLPDRLWRRLAAVASHTGENVSIAQMAREFGITEQQMVRRLIGGASVIVSVEAVADQP